MTEHGDGGMFEVPGDRLRELRAAEAEAKRLRAAVEAHKRDRYGDPAKGPFFAVDLTLYKAAGL